MSSEINIPLIASGGASSYDMSFYECFSVGCDAVASVAPKYFSLYRANTLWVQKNIYQKKISQ